MAGKYLFENLAPGHYVIQVGLENFETASPLEGHVSSTGNDPLLDPDMHDTNNQDSGYDPGLLLGVISSAVTLISEEEPVNDGDSDNTTNLTIDFGFYEGIQLGNYVWDDVNGDGMQDSNEEGINGVEVILYSDAGVELARDTTMQNPDHPTQQGYYQFENLTPGSYYLEFGSVGDLIPTMPGQGSDEAMDSDVDGQNGPNTTGMITLLVGDDGQNIDAGFFLPAKIGDYVWVDDGDFVQGPGDFGINNIVVHLYNDLEPNIPFRTTLTKNRPDNGMAGYYLFDSLPVGRYFVEFDLPQGYTFVAPNQITPDLLDVDDEFDSDVINFALGRTGAFDLSRGQCIFDVDEGVRI